MQRASLGGNERRGDADGDGSGRRLSNRQLGPCRRGWEGFHHRRRRKCETGFTSARVYRAMLRRRIASANASRRGCPCRLRRRTEWGQVESARHAKWSLEPGEFMALGHRLRRGPGVYRDRTTEQTRQRFWIRLQTQQPSNAATEALRGGFTCTHAGARTGPTAPSHRRSLEQQALRTEVEHFTSKLGRAEGDVDFGNQNQNPKSKYGTRRGRDGGDALRRVA